MEAEKVNRSWSRGARSARGCARVVDGWGGKQREGLSYAPKHHVIQHTEPFLNRVCPRNLARPSPETCPNRSISLRHVRVGVFETGIQGFITTSRFMASRKSAPGRLSAGTSTRVDGRGVWAGVVQRFSPYRNLLRSGAFKSTWYNSGMVAAQLLMYAPGFWFYATRVLQRALATSINRARAFTSFSFASSVVVPTVFSLASLSAWKMLATVIRFRRQVSMTVSALASTISCQSLAFRAAAVESLPSPYSSKFPSKHAFLSVLSLLRPLSAPPASCPATTRLNNRLTSVRARNRAKEEGFGI